VEGLSIPEEYVDTAFAIAVTEAASCSGGEFFHLSSGFMVSKAGVDLLGISIASAYLLRMLGEVDRGWRTLPLLRALANQFVI